MVTRVQPRTQPAPQPKVRSAYEYARQNLGRNAADLKVDSSAVGRAMHDGIPNNINCANFVSGCLEAAGQIKPSQHSDSAQGLSDNLGRDPNFESVSLRNAKPGDVVLMNTGEGHHIVMFAGWKDGKVGGTPLFIGSNNANADGSQRVTITGMNYQIEAIHHFKGGPEVVGATEGASPSVGGSGGGAPVSSGGGGGGSPVSGGRPVSGPSGLSPSGGGGSAAPVGAPAPSFGDSFDPFTMDFSSSWDDFLAALAEQGISEEEFLKANPQLKKGQKLDAGTKINLPKGANAAALKSAVGQLALTTPQAPATAPAGTPSLPASMLTLTAGRGVAA